MRCVSFFHVGAVPTYLQKMVASVRATMPTLPIVQMTDDECPEIAGVDEVVRRPYYGLLSKSRIDHLRDYPHDEMLILDTDIIVKQSVEHVFDVPFDVAFTKRYRTVRSETGYDITRVYPYNCGVMFSRNRRFWKDCADMFVNEFGLDECEWTGEQLSMNVIAERGGYQVKDLSCDLYNWTPTSADETSDAYIWHYKGGRKGWMEAA